jgi:EAL domain-containing protein (putative c-di-GMP-specific phosphodiesterase class I)
MELIAEGVETIDQAKFLQSQGCPEMQGFYFYKPMPVGEYENLINDQTMRAKSHL